MTFLKQLQFQTVFLALCQITGGALIAGQRATVELPASPANATNENHVSRFSVKSTPEGGPGERKPVPPPDIPVPPAVKSPVAFFRELLAMTPSERSLALSNRPAETRKQILVKVREYRSMSENERELRLQATELEWHLVPLMK